MKTIVKSASGKEYSINKQVVAHIDPQRCANCGKCREMCPVEAISEQQRVICRLCPSCTSKPALTHEQMFALATEKACTTACPLGISPQGYINLTRAGKKEAAYHRIWDKNPLPSICGRICHHPCEQACKRGILVDEPLAIRGIKRYLSDSVDFKPEPYPVIFEEKIAVIGAGPAGLTAAHYLSLEGYRVTVFDAEAKAGGMMQRAIPTFRLPREVIDKEVEKLEEAGITIRYGQRMSDKDMEALKEEFDAVVIATGTPNPKELMLEGWRREGIMTALGFMERVNNGQQIWRHPGQEFNMAHGNVVVIGGGDVAMDCARTAVRCGAKKVTCACLESGDKVPAHAWEKAEAEEEHITVIEGVSPQKFLGTHNELSGVEFAKVLDMGKDDQGQFFVHVDADERMTLDADWVIVAVGQKPDNMWMQFKDQDGIFFAGDISGSPCSVVDAMASGKATAGSIVKYLRGAGEKDTLELRKLNEAPLEEKIYPATRLKISRPSLPMADPEERIHNFEEVEQTYTEEVVDVEVSRCLQCGYQKVDTDKCLGCGVCKSVCPKGDVITMTAVK